MLEPVDLGEVRINATCAGRGRARMLTDRELNDVIAYAEEAGVLPEHVAAARHELERRGVDDE